MTLEESLPSLPEEYKIIHHCDSQGCTVRQEMIVSKAACMVPHTCIPRTLLEPWVTVDVAEKQIIFLCNTGRTYSILISYWNELSKHSGIFVDLEGVKQILVFILILKSPLANFLSQAALMFY